MKLPIYKSAISMRALDSGIYIFTGTSAATFSLPNTNVSEYDAADGRFFFIKNEGTADLTVNSNSGNFFLNASVSSLVLTPGQGYILAPDNAYYAVFATHNADPLQAATASAPAHRVGGVYFDTTLNKLRVGGASEWETITSA